MITIGTGVGFSLIRKEQGKPILAPDPVIWQILKINKIPNTKHGKYISSFKKISKIYNQRQGKKLPREAIFQDLENNQDIIKEYIQSFKTGIEKINQEIPLKNICLGGSFALYQKYYLKELQEQLPEYHIFVSKYYNDAGIIGATQLPVQTK